ncbi:conserved repeat domain-containing protein [Cellulosimicrobium cellulans J1]|nr:conserved repeat domain-containing protein [Cellulosimicrobium cellulans J1]
MALVTAGSGLAAAAAPANAATVYELEGAWSAGTPTTVATGDAVSASWWFNLNDDAAAPGNAPVDDVTITVTGQGAVFDSIPPVCLTDGVDPASSISDDGATLVCNVGTQDEGTAFALTTPMRVTAQTGEPVSAGATVADQEATVPDLVVQNAFLQDIRWVQATTQSGNTATYRDMVFNWTLFHGTHSPAGPSEVTYALTLSNTLGATMQLGPDGCRAFTSGSASGHPWSGGSNDPSQTAPFVGTCTLTRNSSTSYSLTLSGIDYSHTQVPTKDSAGANLPTDRVAVASGQVQIRVMTASNSGGITLTSNAPTYTAVDGQTYTDDASNNSVNRTWTAGYWSHAWTPAYTGQSGSSWSDTYRVAAGTEVSSFASVNYPNVSTPNATQGGLCVVLDTQNVEFTGATTRFDNNRTGPEAGLPLAYYTGTSALLNPDSGSYQPNDFTCNGTTGWTTTRPTDLSTIKAVRTVFTPTNAIKERLVALQVTQRVKETTPVGRDVWTWGAYINAVNTSNVWVHPNRSSDTADMPLNGTATPGSRYAYAAGGRDVLRVIGVTPDVRKSVLPITVDPSGEATYTLTYSANGTGAVAPTVDDYVLVDTLPAGATYVGGSASPEPAVTTNGSGQQVLTWTLDGVATNAEHSLSYVVRFPDDLQGGDRLVNTVSAAVEGVTSDDATASVVVSDSGLTKIIKTADQAFIPNLAGDGVGTGSWTVLVRSQDPIAQSFVDVIDILPYVGDGRGTAFSGSYLLDGPVTSSIGGTVYYTTADPTTLTDDPADPSNGSAGSVAGNTVGWTTEYTPDATAVRVITGTLAPRGELTISVPVVTDGMVGGDTLVNRSQGRAENTRLVMRTSAPTSIANYYSASLKKYVQDADGEWRDANDPLDYPQFRVGDTVRYRIVVENTGQGTLTNVVVSDDLQPELGSFTIESLAPGEVESHEFEIVLSEPVDDAVVNTACADADVPEDSGVEPTINCDPAGFTVVGTPTHTKEIVSATPVGDGRWEVVYEVVVSNTQTPSTTYSLTDELHFTDQATIVSATVTQAPDGVVLADPAWDGQENLTIASDVPLAGNDDDGYEPHVYRVTVLADVPLQLDGAGSGADDPTACPAEGSDADQGFNNTSGLTGPDGETEEDQACAPIPSIDVEKRVAAGPTPNGDGTWTVTYDVVATNSGTGDGVYEVTDRMTADGDLEVVSGAVTSAPDGVTPSATWTGLGAEGAPENVIASAVTLPAGTSHAYEVQVVLTIAPGTEGAPVVTPCSAEPGGSSGGLSNAAGVEHNDLTDTAEACVTLAAITVEKSISAGPTPNGDGTWTVVYDVVAENVGAAAGEYDVYDRLRYGDGIEIVDAAVTSGPDGVTTNAAWTGLGEPDTAAENLVAADVELAAGGLHTFQVEVTVRMDEATIDPVALRCPPPGSGASGGLANSTSLDHNGIVAEDEVCASLPLIGVEKSISAGPVPQGDGTWAITYDLVATNAGEAAGDYDLVDRLQYGEGVVVESAAVVSAPDGVATEAGWTGQGAAGSTENVVAAGVTLGAGAAHTYQVQVVVSLDRAVVTPSTLACPEPGSGEGGGLANATELTHNGETQGDDVCAELPLIDIAKSLSGAVTPVEGEPGVYDAVYEITVTNAGPGDGLYDLTDELAPGEGVEVLGVQDVVTDAPEPVGLNPGFDGTSDTLVVAGQPIAGATTAPVVHTYTVTVRYAADLSDVEIPDTDACTTGDGSTVAGGLANTATVGWNGLDGTDDACVRPGKPTLDKALVSAAPAGDGTWEVVYDLTVGNVGGEATTYDLDDELLFAPVVTVDSVAVTGPEGVTVNAGFDGATDQRIATGVSIAGMDDEGYAPHVYRVTVVAHVPLSFAADDVDGDGTGSPACTVPAGSNTLQQGLNNAATLTDETGGTQTDTDCAPLPSIDVTKSTDGDPVQGDDGSWTVRYAVTVTNDGGSAGAYDLTDRLRYGAGITVRSATVTATPEGVTASATWTGQGAEGDAANVVAADVDLAPGATHVYRVEVVAAVDPGRADATTFTCPAPGSGEAGGFANTAGVGHNDLTDAADACAAPPEPANPGTPGKPGGSLATTGATLAWVAGGAALLLLLGMLALLAARRRRLTS